MTTFLQLIFVTGFLVLVWYLRSFFRSSVMYKEARRAEIKRRLQVENKQEKALKQLLLQPMDDDEKFRLVQKFANERHQRATYNVIQDMFERQG